MPDPIIIKAINTSSLANAFNVGFGNVVVLRNLLNPYKIPPTPKKASSTDYPAMPYNAPDQGVSMSSFGTQVMTNITFKSVSYTNLITNTTITTPEVVYELVLMSVNQDKNIVKSDLQGLDGSIKEYIGQKDFAVVINGIINGGNGIFPRSDMSALTTVMNAPVAFPIVCQYLNDAGIYNLVIASYSYGQEAGGYSKQPFTLNCISDKLTILELSN